MRLFTLHLLFLIGCAAPRSRAPSPPLDGGFPTPEARLLACLDVQDHLVDVYAAGYLKTHPDETLSSEERKAFREDWAEEVAKSGAFERFDAACARSMTVGGFGCALRAGSPEGVTSCLRTGGISK